MGGKGGGGMPNPAQMTYRGGGRGGGGGSRGGGYTRPGPSGGGRLEDYTPEQRKALGDAYLKSNPDIKSNPYYARNPLAHYTRHGNAERRTFDPKYMNWPGADRRQIGSGDGGMRSGGPNRSGGGRGFNRTSMAKATGAAAGAALGNFLLGPLGTGQGGRLGYLSGQEGYVGDFFNARRGEGYRDFLEDKGVSRKDVKLAGRHPGTLEREAKSRGYTGDASGSILSEGEDYDSITGEIF